MKKLLDNGTLVTLGLVGVVAAVGAANKAGLYGSRALLSASGLSKLTDAELEDYWESLSPSMRNTEAWHLAVTERNVREYRLPNGPAYAAFKASRRSRGSPNEGSASYGVAVSASVEKDSLSGLWSVHLHNGRYIVNVTGDVFTTKAAADREAKAMLAQSRAGVAIDTLGSMFWEKHHKPLGSAARAMTRDEALSQLRSTGEISTGMLAPLGLSMDQFLRYAQLPTHRQKAFVDVLLQRAATGSAARALRGPPHAGPSVKRMVDFLKIPKVHAAAVKARMDDGVPYKAILEVVDELMDGNGVEYIDSHADTMRSQDGLSYVNMGDTYDTTLLYDHKTGRFSVGSWGDIVEKQPARFR